MTSFLPHDKQGNLRAGPFFVAVGFLILITAAISTGLVLGWPHLWPLFVILQALALPPLLYILVSRPRSAKRAVLDAASSPAPTGLIDELTRTLNRRGITSSLIEAMAQSQRYGTPVSLASLRVDGITACIERLGEGVEATLLESASAVLGEVLRLPDRLGRYQDHEFLVVLPQTHAEQAAMVAERLRAAMQAAVVAVKGEEVTVTLSAGVAEFGRGQDLERFLANAHDALHEAYREGGNRVCVFKPLRAKGAS